MRLGSLNSISLKISHDLQTTQRALERALRRMSTGSSLEGGYDPVKWHQSTSLSSSIRGFRQSILSLNSTQAVLETASAGLRSQLEIVQKMKELAVQGGSGLLSAAEREGIQTQLVELRKEFESIGSLQAFKKESPLNSFRSGDSASLTNSGTGFILDTNGDGTKDIVAIDSATNTIHTKFLDENGESFGGKVSAATAISTQGVVKDVNQDGLDDLILGLEVYLSNGDGSFSLTATLDYNVKPGSAMYLTDQNGDGIEDLLFVDTTANLVLMLGNEDGTYQAGVSTATPYVADLNVGDINSDGVDDIAYISSTNSVSWSLSNGDGTFQAASVLGTSYTYIVDIAMGNFANDAGVELLVRDGLSNTLRVYAGSSGGYGVSAEVVLPTYISNMKVMDWNDDGRNDLVGTNGANLILFSGMASLSATLTAGSSISQIHFDDLNGDGFEDFLTLSNGGDSFSLFERNTKSVAATADLNLLSIESARLTLEILESAQSLVLKELSKIETQSSSAERYKEFLINQQAAHEEAKERLVTVDLAKEMSDLVRTQIMQQAQVAALAQANLHAGLALELLRPPSRN